MSDAGLFVGTSYGNRQYRPGSDPKRRIAGFLVLIAMRMIAEMSMAIPGTQTFPDFARQGVDDWSGYMVGRISALVEAVD